MSRISPPATGPAAHAASQSPAAPTGPAAHAASPAPPAPTDLTAPALAPSLVRATGWGYYPVAALARLPFAMVVVGVLTYVATVTGSVALGGLASGAVGVGVVLAGPVVGALVDRHGQRPVVPVVGLLNAGAVALVPLVVGADANVPTVVAVAFLAGATVPQVAPLSRTRLVTIVGVRVVPERRVPTFAHVMSYESAVDETAFVVGPVVVGALAAWVAPWLPLVVAAALSLTAVVAFALHPTASVRAPGHAGEVRAPLREIVRARVLVVVGGAFAVGLFFGTTLTSLTAFMAEQGRGDGAGLVYGAMGLTSAVLALGVALLPRAFAPRWRWVVFGAAIVVSSTLYAGLGPDASAVGALLLMGIGVGPVLVTVLSMTSSRSPQGRAATTMTLTTAALALAQAVASAVTGQLAEVHGASAAMVLPLASAVLLVVLGLVNAALERRAA